MRQIRKSRLRLALLSLLLFLGIGYAIFRTALEIDGTVNIARTSWDVHFENLSVTTGSVTASPAPVTDNATTTEMTYTIGFTKPGDFYEFTVDIVNDGTMDAMVDVVSNTSYASNGTTVISLPTYLTSTVTYNDGVAIKQNQLLAHNTSEKIKVRVEFKKDITTSDLPSSGDTTIVFKFVANYKQADSNRKPVRVNFATDSWQDIVDSYEEGSLSTLQQAMENGTTREVQLDMNHDGTPETTKHVRIANLSIPDECETEGFSQTACGFVIEFADVIENRSFNSWGYGSENGHGSIGGWQYSGIRAYLNDTTYAAADISYEGSGLYSALPSDLRSKIIPTYVVSSSYFPTQKFTTTDYIYLLAAHEVWEEYYAGYPIYDYDHAFYDTRQLDYYLSQGINSGSVVPKKMYNGGENLHWWLRSVSSGGTSSVFHVYSSGSWYTATPDNSYGISPAFRIAPTE